MPSILPSWAQPGFRTVASMSSLPQGFYPNTAYLCFRSKVRANGEPEKRCTMAIDFWGPDYKWGSPHLGDGVYVGLVEIPSAGPVWNLSGEHQPPMNSLCLVYVPSAANSYINAVERWYYIGFRDCDGAWRLKLDSLARKRGFPESRRYAQIYDDGNLLWLPLPSSSANT